MKQVLKKFRQWLSSAAMPSGAEAGEADSYRARLELPDSTQALQTYCSRLASAQKARLAAEFLYACLQEMAGYRAFCELGGSGLRGRANTVSFEAVAVTPDPQGTVATLETCYAQRELTGHAGNTLEQVLGTDFSNAFDGLKQLISDELRASTLSFRKQGTNRHVCRAQKIYNTINLPHTRIRREDAQRDCERRVAKFGLNEALVSGKTLLDLGSNIGGMIFELQKFSPAFSRGIEYDNNKVRIAKLVCTLNEPGNVVFEQGDIDELRAEDVGGGADLVFALTINRHVKDEDRLYRLLAEVTHELLCFEGNAGTELAEVKARLLAAGFSRVDDLGLCDDDILPDNNCRPVLKAWK